MSVLHGEDDALVWRMHVEDHLLLRMLLEELDQALDGPTDDPVVERLFPPAVEGDTDEDAELRTLIAADLLMQRHEAIRLLLGVLDRTELPDQPEEELLAGSPGPVVEVELVEDEPSMMLSVLNDVRLALAQRVGLTAVELPQLVDDTDERSRAVLAILDRLAWFQMLLLREIDPVAVAHAEPDED